MNNSAPNVMSLSEIKELIKADHKLYRLTALLEYKLRALNPNIKITSNSSGELVIDENGDSPDLDQLIRFYQERFPNFEEVNNARKIRNRLAHPQLGDREISQTELESSVSELIRAIENLDAITKPKSSFGEEFIIPLGIAALLFLYGYFDGML